MIKLSRILMVTFLAFSIFSSAIITCMHNQAKQYEKSEKKRKEKTFCSVPCSGKLILSTVLGAALAYAFAAAPLKTFAGGKKNLLERYYVGITYTFFWGGFYQSCSKLFDQKDEKCVDQMGKFAVLYPLTFCVAVPAAIGLGAGCCVYNIPKIIKKAKNCAFKKHIKIINRQERKICKRQKSNRSRQIIRNYKK